MRTQDGELTEGGWPALADAEATVALYMGRTGAGRAAARLIAEGRSPSTPALAIENASRPGARLVRTRLGELGPAVEAAGFTGPVLLVIGEVAAFAAAGQGAAEAAPEATLALRSGGR